jgi:hypothetical protein
MLREIAGNTSSRMKSSGHRMWRVHARASKTGINV